MIHFDTNFLIGALIRGTPAEKRLVDWRDRGEVFGMSAIAWSEFLCGPLPKDLREIATNMIVTAEPFSASDAELAANLFNLTGRRSRTLADCQIAAVAIRLNASVATANESDFKPFVQFGLRLA
jgi:predicted nucleic acid-binding protein